MQLIDTHCHIHEADYPLEREAVMEHAAAAGVTTMICVGTSERSSQDAIAFAAQHKNIYASVGVHPHDTKDGYSKIVELAREYTGAQRKHQGVGRVSGLTSETQSEVLAPLRNVVVAVGEIGLDYYYNHSPREVQIAALESQIQTALDHDLPIIFHVREASSAQRRTSVWNDFWPVFDNFHGIRGELHSFTDTQENLDQGFARGLYVGVNGISTFTKDPAQQRLYAAIPLERMLLETDAPFLTPAPNRGTINEPAYVSEVARHHASLRGIAPENVAAATTKNAQSLFGLA